MATQTCPQCGGALENGFVSTTNGSGLFWSHEDQSTRVRPTGLEVLVPTGFMGTYSANMPGRMCRKCGTISVLVRPTKTP
jgi:hypothetical protein